MQRGSRRASASPGSTLLLTAILPAIIKRIIKFLQHQEEERLWDPMSWVQISALSLTGCVTSGRGHKLSGLQCPPLYNGDKSANTCLPGLFGGVEGLVIINGLLHIVSAQ